jgi:1,4-alpha-glucan branching enzyme
MVRKKKTEKSKTEEKILTRKAQFKFPAPEAQKVFLAGEFNQWDHRANPMEKDQQGIWKTTLSLKPGRYEYRFLVDSKWENDPSCSSFVPNEFGSLNCVRIVE